MEVCNMLKKFFYNNLKDSLLKPHAPYYKHSIYRKEQMLFKSLFDNPNYNFIGDCDLPEDCRHDVLIYSMREGVYGDFRWLVPELKIPNVEAFIQSKASKKTAIIMNVAYDDPQVYISSFSEKALFCENHRELWKHPLVQADETSMYNNYFNPLAERVGSFDLQKEKMHKIKDYLKCDKVFVPISCLESFRENGLKDEESMVFLENRHVIEDRLALKSTKPLAERTFDIFFCGAISQGIYPVRFAFVKILKNIKDLKICNFNEQYLHHLHGNRKQWREKYEQEVRDGLRKDVSDFFLNRAFELLDEDNYSNYMGNIENSKISLCCASVFGYPLRKFFEAMAMGTVVVGQLPKYAERYGIIDGVHMVSCTIDNMEETVRSLLKDEERMKKIAENAKELVKNQYSISYLADKWMDSL